MLGRRKLKKDPLELFSFKCFWLETLVLNFFNFHIIFLKKCYLRFCTLTSFDSATFCAQLSVKIIRSANNLCCPINHRAIPEQNTLTVRGIALHNIQSCSAIQKKGWSSCIDPFLLSFVVFDISN